MKFLPKSYVDIEGRFNGIVTFINEGKTSHARARALADNIPLAVWPGPELLRSLDGQMVVLTVTNRSASIRKATKSDLPRISKPRRIKVQLPSVTLEGDNYFLAPNDPEMVRPNVVGNKPAQVNRLSLHSPRLSDPRIHPEFAKGVGIPYRTFIHLLKKNGVYADFKKLIQSLTGAEGLQAAQTLKKIRRLIMGLNTNALAPRFWTTLEQAEGHPQWEKGTFVRDSTNAQDLEKYPGVGAGIYLTIPHIVGKRAFWPAIKKVMASVWTDEAFENRRKYQINETTVFPAAWLVPSLPADFSCVIHTSDVALNEPSHLVIEAVQGLGESLVGDDNRFAGSPTQIIWDKTRNRIVEKSPGNKKRCSVLSKTGGTKTIPVTKEFLKLPDANRLIRSLCEIGQQTEAQAKNPRDIEVVITADPQQPGHWTITIVQTRTLGRVNGSGSQGTVPLSFIYFILTLPAIHDWISAKFSEETTHTLISAASLIWAAGEGALAAWLTNNYGIFAALAWLIPLFAAHIVFEWVHPNSDIRGPPLRWINLVRLFIFALYPVLPYLGASPYWALISHLIFDASNMNYSDRTPITKHSEPPEMTRFRSADKEGKRKIFEDVLARSNTPNSLTLLTKFALRPDLDPHSLRQILERLVFFKEHPNWSYDEQGIRKERSSLWGPKPNEYERRSFFNATSDRARIARLPIEDLAYEVVDALPRRAELITDSISKILLDKTLELTQSQIVDYPAFRKKLIQDFLHIRPMMETNGSDMADILWDEFSSDRPWFNGRDVFSPAHDAQIETRVATIAGHIIGAVAFRYGEGKESIAEIGVHPDYRRLGVGHRLMENVKNSARYVNNEKIILAVPERSIENLPFFLSEGFQHASQPPHAKKKTIDGVETSVYPMVSRIDLANANKSKAMRSERPNKPGSRNGFALNELTVAMGLFSWAGITWMSPLLGLWIGSILMLGATVALPGLSDSNSAEKNSLSLKEFKRQIDGAQGDFPQFKNQLKEISKKIKGNPPQWAENIGNEIGKLLQEEKIILEDDALDWVQTVILFPKKRDKETIQSLVNLVLFLAGRYNVFLDCLEKPEGWDELASTIPTDPQERDAYFKHELAMMGKSVQRQFMERRSDPEEDLRGISSGTRYSFADVASQYYYLSLRFPDHNYSDLFVSLLESIPELSEKYAKTVFQARIRAAAKAATKGRVSKVSTPDIKIPSVFPAILSRAESDPAFANKLLDYRATSDALLLRRDMNKLWDAAETPPFLHDAENPGNSASLYLDIGSNFHGLFTLPEIKKGSRKVVFVTTKPEWARFLKKAALVIDVEDKVKVHFGPIAQLPTLIQPGSVGTLHLETRSKLNPIGLTPADVGVLTALMKPGGRIVVSDQGQGARSKPARIELAELLASFNLEEDKRMVALLQTELAGKEGRWALSFGHMGKFGGFLPGFSGYADRDKQIDADTLVVFTRPSETADSPADGAHLGGQTTKLLLLWATITGILAQGQNLWAQGRSMREIERSLNLGRGVGVAGNDLLPAFLLTLIISIPLCILGYLLLGVVISRYSHGKSLDRIYQKKDSFSFSATLLLIGYLATFLMVGTLSNSWMMGPINIATNILWFVTFVFFYFLYRFAKADYSLSWPVKTIVILSIVASAGLTNYFKQGWSPVSLASNFYASLVAVVTMGILLGLVLIYSIVSLRMGGKDVKEKRKRHNRQQKLTDEVDNFIQKAPHKKPGPRDGFTVFELTTAIALLSWPVITFLNPTLGFWIAGSVIFSIVIAILLKSLTYFIQNPQHDFIYYVLGPHGRKGDYDHMSSSVEEAIKDARKRGALSVAVLQESGGGPYNDFDRDMNVLGTRYRNNRESFRAEQSQSGLTDTEINALLNFAERWKDHAEFPDLIALLEDSNNASGMSAYVDWYNRTPNSAEPKNPLISRMNEHLKNISDIQTLEEIPTGDTVRFNFLSEIHYFLAIDHFRQGHLNQAMDEYASFSRDQAKMLELRAQALMNQIDDYKREHPSGALVVVRGGAHIFELEGLRDHGYRVAAYADQLPKDYNNPIHLAQSAALSGKGIEDKPALLTRAIIFACLGAVIIDHVNLSNHVLLLTGRLMDGRDLLTGKPLPGMSPFSMDDMRAIGDLLAQKGGPHLNYSEIDNLIIEWARHNHHWHSSYDKLFDPDWNASSSLPEIPLVRVETRPSVSRALYWVYNPLARSLSILYSKLLSGINIVWGILTPVGSFLLVKPLLSCMNRIGAVNNSNRKVPMSPTQIVLESLLKGTPINLGLGETLRTDPLRKNSGTLIFVDPSLEAHLEELVKSLDPHTPTTLVAQTNALAERLRGLVNPAFVSVVDGDQTGALQGGEWRLKTLETYFGENAVQFPIVARIIQAHGSMNIVSSQNAPAFNWNGLDSNSIFLQKETIYLLIDELLKALSARWAPDVQRSVDETSQTLKAA